MSASMTRRLRAALVLLGVVSVAAAVTAAAGGSSSRDIRASTAPTRVTVYFVRGEHLAPVGRALPHTLAVARASLRALLAGPTAAERRAGYRSLVPVGTTLRDIAVSGRVATVDLSRRFASGGGSFSMLTRVAQVVFTTTQFPTVDRVRFRLDGTPVKAIGGEGVVVAPSVARSGFEDQSPPILVEQPLPGDTIGSPFLVRGTANVFEAQLFVDVVSPTGHVLAHRDVLASAGTGTRGTFSAKLHVAPGHAVVVAYTRSPKNGARIDIVRVPVTIR